MNKFATLAKSTIAGSDGLFKDKQRLTMDQMIQLYPDGVQVTEFRKLKGQNGDFYLFAFAQDPAACFSGTKVLDDIADAWVEQYNGDVVACSDDLKKDAGVKIRMYWQTGKSGRNYVAVDVVG